MRINSDMSEFIIYNQLLIDKFLMVNTDTVTLVTDTHQQTYLP